MPLSKHWSLVLLSAVRRIWSLVTGRWSLLLAFLCAVSCICSLSTVTAHADFAVSPSIGVSEEYNDNIFETPEKKTDYITSLMPGLTLSYNAPFWDWDIAYNFAYRYYARKSHDDESNHNLALHGLTRLIDDFLFLDISDNYSRVSLNIARDRTQESQFVNQSDSNNFTASPYFRFHPLPKVLMRTGYRYMNVWYRDPSGIDRRDHVGFLETTYELSPKLSLTGNYTYTHENSIQGFNRHEPALGFRYEYKERSNIFGQGGYTWFSSKNGTSSNNPYWNAGITHSFDHISISLTTGVQYPVDPVSGVTRETDYSFAINKVLQRGNIGVNVSYAKYSGDNVDIESRYSGGVTVAYELLEHLNTTLSASIEKYDHRDVNSYTRRIYVSPGLSYMFPKEISLALNYFYIDSYSPDILSDRYDVNRITLELRKSFGRVLARQDSTGSAQ
jgi:predicted porin